MAIDFSCTATRKERERYENNFSLGVNGQGPKPGPIKKRQTSKEAGVKEMQNTSPAHDN